MVPGIEGFLLAEEVCPENIEEKNQYQGGKQDAEGRKSKFFHNEIVPPPGRLRYTSRPQAPRVDACEAVFPVSFMLPVA